MSTEITDEAAAFDIDRARARLDRATDLISQALDLRELLWCGIDLDLGRDLVDQIKRDIEQHRRWE